MHTTAPTNNLDLKTTAGPLEFKLKPGTPISHLAVCTIAGEQLFRVTMQGRVIHNDIDITDDDSAMAKLLCEWLQKQYGITVNRSE